MTDELIRPGSEAPGFTRGRSRFVLLCFFSWIFGTLLVDLAWPAEAPVLYGMERFAYDRLERDARWDDGSLASFVERRQRINSRTRRLLGPLWATASVRVLDAAPEVVVLGQDDWIFVRARVGDPDLTARELTQCGAELLGMIERRLSAHGVELHVVPVPRKTTLLADKLPPGFDARPQIEQLMAGQLQRRGVRLIDLTGALMSLPPEQRYWKYDPHWTYQARSTAARAMAEQAGQLVAYPQTRLVPRPAESDAAGLLMAGIVPGSWCAELFFEAPPDQAFVLRAGDTSKTPIDAPRERACRLALVGTSFSSRLVDSLAHYSGESVQNNAEVGLGFLGTFGPFLDKVERFGWPEVLWYEFPLHQAFTLARQGRFDVPPAIAQVLARMPAVPVQPLPTAGTIKAGPNCFALSPGRLVTMPGTQAYLRLRPGPDGRRGGRWRLHSGETRASYEWPEERDEFLIPILSGRAAGSSVRLEALGPAAATTPQIDLVTDLDLAGARSVPVRTSRLEQADSPPTHSAKFGGTKIERHQALVLRLLVGAASRVQVRATTAEGRFVDWNVSVDKGKSSVLLGLSELVGKELNVVHIRSLDGVATRVDSLQLAPLARVGGDPGIAEAAVSTDEPR